MPPPVDGDPDVIPNLQMRKQSLEQLDHQPRPHRWSVTKLGLHTWPGSKLRPSSDPLGSVHWRRQQAELQGAEVEGGRVSDASGS